VTLTCGHGVPGSGIRTIRFGHPLPRLTPDADNPSFFITWPVKVGSIEACSGLHIVLMAEIKPRAQDANSYK